MKAYEELKAAIEEAPTIPPCQDSDPDVWFSDPTTSNFEFRTAKNFCAQCPVQNPCLVYALTKPERHGIWGGLTYKERLLFSNNRGQNR